MALELFSLFAKISLDSSELDKGLDKSKKSMSDYKKDVMTLAQTYKQQGMSMSDAMKKAYAEIDKSQYETASVSGKTSKTVSGNWGDAANKLGAVGGKLKDALGVTIKAAAVGLTAASAGVVAFGKSSVDAGMQFDSSMAQVAATMGKTVDEIGNLRDFAMEMGAKTAFSASQAADALNYMALAGYDAETSMSMLPNVLNLAAAGGMELAAASDMITDSQSALGLSLDETAALVDKMAKASSKSNTSVSQLGSAILTVGGTAKAMKGGTTELAQVLGIIADNGVKGAEGGTALRNIILSLTAPTDKAAKSLKDLGVDVLDSSGNMRSMQDIFADLNKSLGNLSEGQKTAVLSEIFNKVDLKSVNALMATNAERWNELSAAIDDSAGAAQAMADTQLDNLAGDIKIFQSAVEGAQIVLSDQLTPALREFVQFGTSGVTAVTDAFKREEAVRGLSDAIRDAEGNLLSAGQVAGVLSETLYSMSESDREIAIREIFNTDDMEYVNELLSENGENWGYLMGYVAEIDAASEATNGWAAAMGTLGPVVSDAVSMILEGLPQAVKIGGQLLGAVVTGVIDALPALADGALQVAEALGSSLIDAAPSLLESGGQLLEGLVTGITEGLPKLTEAASGILESFGGYIRDNLPMLAESGLSMLEGLSGSIRENAGKLVDSGLELLQNLAQGFADSIPAIIEHVPTIISNIAGVINDNAPKILAAGVSIILTIANGIVKAIPTLIANIPKIIKMIFDVWNAVNWLSLGTKAVTLIKNGISALKSKIPEALKTIADNASKFFKSVDWVSLGKTAITFIGSGIKTLATAIPTALKNIATTAVNWFKSVSWLQVGKDIINGLIRGVTMLGKAAVDAIIGVGKSMLDGFKKLFGIASPSKEFAWIGKMIDEGFAKGIKDNANKAESEAQKLAKSVYSAVTKEAERQIKYERLSLTEQLEVWQQIQSRFKRNSEQWADAYDKIWDIQERIADERAKAEEQRINQRIKAEERRIKYASLSLSEQADIWRDIQRDFEVGSDEWWDAYDKVFDLEKKIADEREKASEKAAQDSYSAVTKWLDKAAKYTDASYATQMRAWRQALGAFEKDSEQSADIEEKLFDLRLSAYQEYADNVEKISGKIDDIQKSYDDAVEKRAQAIAGSYKLFDAIPEKQEASGKELLKNLQGQIKSIRSFYSNLTKLQERGMSAAVVDEIRSMGVGASAELEALLKLSDSKLAQYAGLYAEKQSLANSIAISELDGLKNETESKIQEQMDELKKLYEESAPAIGESFAENLAQGIRNGLSGVTEAAMEAAQAALAKTREILGIGTPTSGAPTRFSGVTPAYNAAAPAYSPAAGASYGDNAGLRYSPITLTVNTNVGGARIAQIQYPFENAEAIRRGPSIINA